MKTLLSSYPTFFVFQKASPRFPRLAPTLWLAAFSALLLAVAPSARATTVTNTTVGPGTWVCPADVVAVQVECWGGGGAGGSCVSSTGAGGGGSGGAYARVNTYTVTPNTTYDLYVGAAGAAAGTGNHNGGAGGSSWFNTSNSSNSPVALGEGGAGGNGGAAGVGGASVTCPSGSVGAVINLGGSGAAGVSGSYGGGGGGSGGNGAAGSSGGTAGGTAAAVTDGGPGGASITGGNNGDAPASGPGGGGGGAYSTGGSARYGGAGAAGQIVLTYVPYYAKSVANGNWSSTSTWQTSIDGGATWQASTVVPDTNAGAIFITNGYTVTVDVPSSATNLMVDYGSTLAIGPAGALTSSGAALGTYAFPILLNGGILDNNNVATNQSFTGIISGAGGVTNVSLGLLALNAANTFSGGLYVVNGLVKTTDASSQGFGAGTITMGNGSSASTAQIATGRSPSNPITLASGATTAGSTMIVSNNGGAVTYSGPITLNGNNLGFNASGSNLTMNISGGITGSGNVSITNLGVNVGGTPESITFSGSPVNNSGTISASSVSTTTGTTTISGGVGANVTAIYQSSGTAPLTISGGLTVNSGGTTLQSSGAALFTVSGSTSGSGNLTVNANSTGAFTLSGTTINPAGYFTNSGTGSGVVTVGAVIGASVTGVTQNSVSSPMVLSGLNTYTGNTTLSAGTLQVDSLENPGASGPLGNQAANAAGTIILNGGTLQYSSLNNADYSGRFSTAASQSYIIDVNGQNVTYASALTSSGGLLTLSNSAAVAGSLTLSAVNTYSGNTTINGNAKLVGVVGGSIANSAVTVNSVTATNSVLINNDTLSFTCASLTTAAAGDLDFNFGAVAPSTTVPPLVVTGAAAFTAQPAVTIKGVNILTGTYPLMTWGSTSGTVPTTVVMPTGSAGNLSVSGSTLYLNVTTGTVVHKANNVNNLNLTTSWVEGYVPVGVAAWDSTVTSPNTTVLGASMGWAVMQILNPAGLVTISADGNTLTNGSSIDMSAATADLTLGCNVDLGGNNTWNVASGRTLTVSGVISDNYTLTKQGAGTLVYSGANTYTNSTDISGGVLTIGAGGALTNCGTLTVADTVSTPATLNIAGGELVTENNNVGLGLVNGAEGVINMSSGSLLMTNQLYLGNAVGGVAGFGALNISGGFAYVSSFIGVGRGASGTSQSRGELLVSGGTLFESGSNVQIGSDNTAATNTSVMLLSGSGSAILNSSGSVIVGRVANGTLTVSNTALLDVSNYSGNIQLAQQSGVVGILNLNGGTISAPKIVQGSGSGYFNFNGGTLQGITNTAALLAATAAYVYPGGALINDGGFAITNAQPLLAPTGNGVSLSGMSFSGSGFVAPPIVDVVAAPGDPGVGASALATIDGSGNLTSVAIVNPGVNYVNPPTLMFTGGGGTVTPSGSVSLVANSSGGLTKSGTGSLILSGTSTYTGNTVINGGILSFGGSGSLAGSPNIQINAGGELLGVSGSSAASGLAVQMLSTTSTNSVSIINNTMHWSNASFTASAAGVLDFNFGSVAPSTTVAPLQITGAATFTATPTVTIEGNNITAGTYPLMTWGSRSGTAPSVVSLPGGAIGTLSVVGSTLDLVITSGDTLVKANNANNLDLTTSWVTGVVPTGTAIWDDTVTSANTTVLGGNLTWTGIQILNPGGLVTISADGNTLINNSSIDMSAATANLTLNCNVDLGGNNTWNVASGQTLTVGGVISDKNTLTKVGAGTLVYNGGNTYTNSTDVSAGVLTIGANGTVTNFNLAVADTASTSAILNINGGTLFTTNNGVGLGKANLANGVINMSSGTMIMSNQLFCGYGGASQAGFGALNMSGGTAVVQNYVTAGRGSASGSQSRGEILVSGGTLTENANNLQIGSDNTAATNTSVMLLSGTGTVNLNSPSGLVIVGRVANGTLTVSNTAQLIVANASQIQIGQAAGVVGILNLNGGTVSASNIVQSAGTGYVNFNGGTLKAGKNTPALMAATAAYVYPGGATIDDGGFNITNAQPLLAPTGGSGKGVSLSGMSFSGSGFVMPPIVDVVAAPGDPGVGASALATIDNNGNLTSVAIVNPGVNYVTAPTLMFTGGGGTVTPSGSVSLVANSGSGGLTKNGIGSLTLSGVSTYAGPTVINAGILSFSGAASIASSSSIQINAGAELAGSSGISAASGAAVTMAAVTATNSVSITNNTKYWPEASFTATGAGVLDFNFGALLPSTTVAPLQIAGAATFTATPTVTIEGSLIDDGTYPLMTWGSSSGTPPSVVGLPAGVVGTLSVAGNTLYLNITVGNGLVKANNANNLNLTTSWTLGTVPTGIAIWDATVTSANTTVLGGDLNWAGMQIFSPGGTVTINNDGNVLTNGASGIDMSAATVNLNLNCNIVLSNAQTWTVASGRTLTVNGSVSSWPATGAINKSGWGTLLMQGSVNYSNTEDVLNGTLIYNGAAVTSNGRVIADAAANSAARLVITNGASVISTSPTGNLRAGRVGALTGTNYVDLAGLYSLPNADAGDGNATLYNACGYSEMTFYPGGDFTAKDVISYGGGSGTNCFRFNGGIIRAAQANTTFITGITNVLVMAGGANIDDRGFAITIPEPLQDAGGGGGLAKIGVGTLTLSAVNTYTGRTAISNGVVALSGSGSVANSSSIQISSGAKLDVSGTTGTYALNVGQTLVAGDTGASATNNGSLNLGSGTLTLNYYSGTPALTETNGTLAFSGNAVTVNVAGTPLANGPYLLVATALGGTVSGALPSTVTVTGPGSPVGATSWLSLSGGQLYLNVDTITATNVSYSRNGLTTWMVAVTNLVANASDADSYALSLAGVAASTNGITPVISGGYVLYYNPSLVDDKFTYTVTNNYGVSGTGTIILTAGSASGVGGQIASFSSGGGALSMSFDGIPGYKYNVQVSTNISYPNGWITLWTTNAPSGGVFQFQDNAPPTPEAYYRLMWNGN